MNREYTNFWRYGLRNALIRSRESVWCKHSFNSIGLEWSYKAKINVCEKKGGLCLDKNRQQSRLVCQFLYLKAVLFVVVVVFKCRDRSSFFCPSEEDWFQSWLAWYSLSMCYRLALDMQQSSCLCFILYVGIIAMYCHMLSQPLLAISLPVWATTAHWNLKQSVFKHF